MTFEVCFAVCMKDPNDTRLTPVVVTSAEDTSPESSRQEQVDSVGGPVKSDIGDRTVSAVDSSLIESRAESELAVHTPLISQQNTDVNRQSDSAADVEPAEHDTSRSATNAPTGVEDLQVDAGVTVETDKQVFQEFLCAIAVSMDSSNNSSIQRRDEMHCNDRALS